MNYESKTVEMFAYVYLSLLPLQQQIQKKKYIIKGQAIGTTNAMFCSFLLDISIQYLVEKSH